MDAAPLRFLPPPRRVPWRDWSEFAALGAMLGGSPTHTAGALPSLSPAPSSSTILQIWEQRGASLLPAELTRQLLDALETCHAVAASSVVVGKGASDRGRAGEEAQARLALGCLLQRMVNGFADASQRKEFASSVMILALKMRLPRSLVDARHETAHSGLPSLNALIRAGESALQWLHEHFWRPQLAHIALYTPPSAQSTNGKGGFLSPFLSSAGAIALALADGDCCSGCDSAVHAAAAVAAGVAFASTSTSAVAGTGTGNLLTSHLRLTQQLPMAASPRGTTSASLSASASAHAYLCARHWLASFEALIAAKQRAAASTASALASTPTVTVTATGTGTGTSGSGSGSSSGVGSKRSASQAGLVSSSSSSSLSLKSHALLSCACTTVRTATRQSLEAMTTTTIREGGEGGKRRGDAFATHPLSFVPLATLIRVFPHYLSSLLPLSATGSEELGGRDGGSEEEAREKEREHRWARRCLAVAVAREARSYLSSSPEAAINGAVFAAVTAAFVATTVTSDVANHPVEGGGRRGMAMGKRGGKKAQAQLGASSHPALASAEPPVSCCGRTRLAASLTLALNSSPSSSSPSPSVPGPFALLTDTEESSCLPHSRRLPKRLLHRFPSLTLADADCGGEVTRLLGSLSIAARRNGGDLQLQLGETTKQGIKALGLSSSTFSLSSLPSASVEKKEGGPTNEGASSAAQGAALDEGNEVKMMMSIDEMEAMLTTMATKNNEEETAGDDNDGHDGNDEGAATGKNAGNMMAPLQPAISGYPSTAKLRKPRWKMLEGWN